MLLGVILFGLQWDALQVIAWTRMIVTASRTMTLADAVRITFTPGNECSLCVYISENRADTTPGLPSSPEAAIAEARKFILLAAACSPAPWVTPPAPAFVPPRPRDASPPASPVAEIPVPPPRLAA